MMFNQCGHSRLQEISRLESRPRHRTFQTFIDFLVLPMAFSGQLPVKSPADTRLDIFLGSATKPRAL